MKRCISASAEYRRASQLMDEMHRMKVVWKEFRPPAPLNHGDMMLLGMLTDVQATGEAPITVSMLAKNTRQSLPAVSQKLRALEELGYVRRQENREDRRVSYVQVTDQGAKMSEESMKQVLGRLEQALDEFGEENTAKLLELLHGVVESILTVQGSHPSPNPKPEAK